MYIFFKDSLFVVWHHQFFHFWLQLHAHVQPSNPRSLYLREQVEEAIRNSESRKIFYCGLTVSCFKIFIGIELKTEFLKHSGIPHLWYGYSWKMYPVPSVRRALYYL